MKAELEIADAVSNIVAARTAFFAHTEELEKLIGRELNVCELETVIDCEFSGRTAVSEREALMILLRANGKPALRAVG